MSADVPSLIGKINIIILSKIKCILIKITKNLKKLYLSCYKILAKEINVIIKLVCALQY